MRGFIYFARETSFGEALKAFIWHPFICLLDGHEWLYGETWEDIEPPLKTESWRQCDRCERFEDLMDR